MVESDGDDDRPQLSPEATQDDGVSMVVDAATAAAADTGVGAAAGEAVPQLDGAAAALQPEGSADAVDEAAPSQPQPPARIVLQVEVASWEDYCSRSSRLRDTDRGITGVPLAAVAALLQQHAARLDVLEVLLPPVASLWPTSGAAAVLAAVPSLAMRTAITGIAIAGSTRLDAYDGPSSLFETLLPGWCTLDLRGWDGTISGGGGGGSGVAGASASIATDVERAQLLSMGFSENACKRATKAVSGAGVEAASNWMFGHMEDADFNDPLPEAAAADTAGGAGSGKPAISEDAIQMLCAIGGFAPRQAEAGLIACDGNNERAADWLFSRMDDLDTAVEAIFAKQAGDAAAGGGGGGGGGGGAGDAGGSGEPDDGPGKGREREGRGTGGEGKKEKVSTRKNVGAVHVCIDPPLVSRHPF